MLNAPLNLTGHNEPDVFDHLYPFFERDFITVDTYINNQIYVDPKGQGIRDGKEEVFWHITTREKSKTVKQGKQMVKIKTRPFDPDRAARISWIKPMLVNHSDPCIKLFYRKETKGKKHVRLYFWAHQHDFVVIVQKLGNANSFLVTSFYITETYKRSSYQKWYIEYTQGDKPELLNCEWF